MSMQRPAILFVGSPDTGAWLQDLVAPQDGYVYQPGDLLEALAMYVNYFPDAIILDARWDSALVERLYYHLMSVEAGPLLIVDSAPDHWLMAGSGAVQVVADENALCNALYETLQLMEPEPCQIAIPSYR